MEWHYEWIYLKKLFRTSIMYYFLCVLLSEKITNPFGRKSLLMTLLMTVNLETWISNHGQYLIWNISYSDNSVFIYIANYNTVRNNSKCQTQFSILLKCQFTVWICSGSVQYAFHKIDPFWFWEKFPPGCVSISQYKDTKTVCIILSSLTILSKPVLHLWLLLYVPSIWA